MKERDLAILGGIAIVGGAALYLLTKKQGGAAITATTAAVQGGQLGVEVQVRNTGNTDWAFGIGATLTDAAGTNWDLYTPLASGQTGIDKAVSSGGTGGKAIDVKQIISGQIGTHRMGPITLPSDIAFGVASLTIVVYKLATIPPSGLLDKKTFANAVTIERPVIITASILDAIIV